MTFEKIDILTREDILLKKKLSSNFCAVPFTSLILEADGLVGCCRMKGGEHSVGSVTKESIQEIWNGPLIKKWRQDFLSGSNKICAKELRHRQCNTFVAPDKFVEIFEPKEIQAYGPLRLGLNLNGQCNLSCPMCKVWTKPNGLYEQPRLRKMIEELLPQVQEIEMLSGEPFIQKATYHFIDLASKINPTCEWNITTNVNWKLTDYVKNKLDLIRFRQLVISMDSLIPEVYAKIRRKGSLDRALKTILDLREYDLQRQEKGIGSLNINLNCTIQKDNWKEIPALLDFGETNGFFTGITLLYNPEEFSLLDEPLIERERILEHYLQSLSKNQLRRSLLVIRPLVESVSPLSRASAVLFIREQLSASISSILS